MVKDKAALHQTKINIQAAEKKSKVRDLVELKPATEIGKRSEYMATQNRHTCSNIFSVRSRMLKVKANYKAMFTDQTCRWCKHREETQHHILTECPELKHITKKCSYADYYTDNEESIKKATTIIEMIKDKIKEKEQSVCSR